MANALLPTELLRKCDLDPDYCVGVGLMGIDLDYDYYSYDYDDVSEDYLELMESCDAQDDSPANSEKVILDPDWSAYPRLTFI